MTWKRFHYIQHDLIFIHLELLDTLRGMGIFIETVRGLIRDILLSREQRLATLLK
jgi:hypothetical protein